MNTDDNVDNGEDWYNDDNVENGQEEYEDVNCKKLDRQSNLLLTKHCGEE